MDLKLFRNEKREIKKRIVETFQHGFYQYGSDNPILFTAQVYLLSKIHGIMDQADEMNFDKCLMSLRRVHESNIVRGLFTRHPGQNDRTIDHDDYVGIASASIHEIYWPATGICHYGERNFWSFDGVHPGRFNFLELRQPFDVLLYRVSANKNIGCVGVVGLIHLFFKIALHTLSSRQHTSSKILDWMRLETMKHKWYVRPHVWLFNKIICRKYKTGIHELIQIYHGGLMASFAEGVKQIELNC